MATPIVIFTEEGEGSVISLSSCEGASGAIFIRDPLQTTDQKFYEEQVYLKGYKSSKKMLHMHEL